MRKLIGEIHRRSLWQVLGIYLAGSWIALQAVETLGDTIGLPGRFGPVAFALLIIGLPIVLATAPRSPTSPCGSRRRVTTNGRSS